MTREELAKLAQSRRRLQIGSLILGLPLLVGSLILRATRVVDQLKPDWLAVAVFPGVAIVVLPILAVLAFHRTLVVPKCPHCKRLLTEYLLHIAVASGNCGYCGKSIED
jgi:hypothetical protein